MKFYVVLHAAKHEGYITDDRKDAEYAAYGIRNGGVPTIAEAFREAYADDDGFNDEESDPVEFEIIEIELPVKKAKRAALSEQQP